MKRKEDSGFACVKRKDSEFARVKKEGSIGDWVDGPDGPGVELCQDFQQ